ncbi:hypothetical protein ACFXPR_15600 [Nocardia tengchongensis]|uniref:hypothetical protein n=1 Tax=Nocardia tengchongensis TaxID=2055889 RepID=UPI00367917EE
MIEKEIGPRLVQYDRWQQQCLYIGAGIGGLALFGEIARDSFAQSSYELRAWFITLVIAAAATLGLGYIQYRYASEKLNLYLRLNQEKNITEQRKVPTSTEEGEVSYSYPFLGYAMALIGLACTIAAAIILITAVWKASSGSPPAEHNCTLKLEGGQTSLVCDHL